MNNFDPKKFPTALNKPAVKPNTIKGTPLIKNTTAAATLLAKFAAFEIPLAFSKLICPTMVRNNIKKVPVPGP